MFLSVVVSVLGAWLVAALLRRLVIVLIGLDKWDHWEQILGLQTDWFYVGVASRHLVLPLRWLAGLGQRLWRAWFALGALIGPVLTVAALLLLLVNAFLLLQPEHGVREQAPLVPLVPGVNVPGQRVPALLLALLLAAMVHEAGHALAALAWGERVDRFGLFLYGVYPGAYVELPFELERLAPRRALAVVAGGVWHNLVLFLALYAALRLSSSLQEDPQSPCPRGLLVTHVRSDDFAAFRVGQRLRALNEVPLPSLAAWHAAFLRLHAHNFTGQGWCAQHLHALHSSPCASHELLWQAGSEGPRCAAPRALGLGASCETSSPDCACVHPVLPEANMLLRVRVEEGGQEEDVWVLGHPYALYEALRLGRDAPWLPPALTELLSEGALLLASLSGALALLNALPLAGLDGTHLVAQTLRLLPPAPWHAQVGTLLTPLVAGLLGLNLLAGMRHILY